MPLHVFVHCDFIYIFVELYVAHYILTFVKHRCLWSWLTIHPCKLCAGAFCNLYRLHHLTKLVRPLAAWLGSGSIYIYEYDIFLRLLHIYWVRPTARKVEPSHLEQARTAKSLRGFSVYDTKALPETVHTYYLRTYCKEMNMLWAFTISWTKEVRNHWRSLTQLVQDVIRDKVSRTAQSARWYCRFVWRWTDLEI